jgi:hypothetical protein
MNCIGDKIKRYWLSMGLSVPSGATERKLKAFEYQYRVLLPPDLRNYFSTVNGMSLYWPDSQDKEGFSFWPLEKVKNVQEEAENHSVKEVFEFPDAISYFIFADYLDWSWSYAIRLSNSVSESTPVFLIGKEIVPIQVANSYSEFVELYFADSAILYNASDSAKIG